MPRTPSQSDCQSAPELSPDTARVLDLVQYDPRALRPVTFRCQGAGAMRMPHEESSILFTFPVHEGKCVRVLADYATATAFAHSLVQTLGGWPAVKSGELKRRNRR